MKLTQTYLRLAAYNYKRAACHAANGDIDKAQAMINAALANDKFAKEAMA